MLLIFLSQFSKTCFLTVLTEGMFLFITFKDFLKTGFLRLFKGIPDPPKPLAKLIEDSSIFKVDSLHSYILRFRTCILEDK